MGEAAGGAAGAHALDDKEELAVLLAPRAQRARLVQGLFVQSGGHARQRAGLPRPALPHPTSGMIAAAVVLLLLFLLVLLV